MPVLFVILIGLAVWAATLPGVGAGYRYYLAPKFSELLDPRIIASAAGQAYFSLSLGMGAILTLASYLDRDRDLGRDGAVIAVSDFQRRLHRGARSLPGRVRPGLQRAGHRTYSGRGGGCIVHRPARRFQHDWHMGRPIAIVFFAGLSMAALTSTVSLLEVVVSALIDEFRLTRRAATLTVGAGVALVGLAPATSLTALGAMNRIGGDIFLGLGAFLTVIAVGWFMEDPVAELSRGASPVARWTLPAWRFVIRWMLPAVTGGVLYFMLRN